jgi:hypothetical protein
MFPEHFKKAIAAYDNMEILRMVVFYNDTFLIGRDDPIGV